MPRSKWNLEYFLQLAKNIHGDKHDYSLITSDMIKTCKDKVPIVCNRCRYVWSPYIDNYIRKGTGCPDCAKQAKWTLTRFLERARLIHDDKYDYSTIHDKDIRGYKSRIVIICNTCCRKWETSLDSHISSRSGCPNCAGQVPWTLERFLGRVQEIHGGNFDYSLVTEDHIKNCYSKIPIICNTCNYQWNPCLDSVANNRCGCPDCAGQASWTLQRFLGEGYHGLYDYSLITEADIRGDKNKVPIICKECHLTFYQTIEHHIRRKQGCPSCKSSHGEKECERILRLHNLEYQREVVLPELPNKRYDFAFAYEDELYLLEFDGIQHFEEVPHFHRKITFTEGQDVDIIKTKVVLARKAHLIRIDYTQVDHVEDHLILAIERGDKLYVSNPEMYGYIISCL